MNNIYAIRRATDPFYRELEFDVMDIARYSPDDVPLDAVTRFFELNTAMSDWWQPIRAQFYDEADDQDKDIPDLCPWVGATLILSPKAFRLLEDALRNDGEFLPLLVGDEEYQLFNCLSVGVDDREASEVEVDGDIELWVNKLATAPENTSQVVFKSKLEKGKTLFAGDLFKTAIEEFGLKGLAFDKNLIESFG
ncbi:conserved hypothetical protein [Teredinibacter turnerae T7901]|uniref:Uncharacterized protein n=1 Tax=Teredinibacter turnerae (strain ATCC 39867 / T7901) TaxID=377629 RepID=C5BUJ1_TERTT|nr:hypothetical protein [Teredinibacter turnerae]ACR10650.1 conserved hypothetical protein [Teredinibacter turnerae T7901]